MRILETERLLIRQFEWTDLDALSAIMGDAEVMKYIGNGKIKTRDQVERLMSVWIDVDGERAWDAETIRRLPQLKSAMQHDAQFSMWAVCDLRKNLIGRCGLLVRPRAATTMRRRVRGPGR